MTSELEKRFYIVIDAEGKVKRSTSLTEALRESRNLRPPIYVYKARLIAVLEADDVGELVDAIGGRRATHVAEHAATREGVKPIAALVFDQMFRGFGDVIARELGNVVEVHEIVGRGISETVKRGMVYLEPARDDYDVLKLLEKLTEAHHTVIFFTGDKKLANQASTLRGVHVVYLPPSEVPGKEIAIKRMISEVRRILEEVWA